MLGMNALTSGALIILVSVAGPGPVRHMLWSKWCSASAAMCGCAGFSQGVARWAVTNLRPLTPLPGQPALNAAGRAARLGWNVDLEGITEMYKCVCKLGRS
jgi:hypothetical protein